MDYVKSLLAQSNSIEEQLVILGRHRNNHDVQEYIARLENYEYLSGYMRYLIDRYYYNKKNTKICKKNSIEKMFKLILS